MPNQLRGTEPFFTQINSANSFPDLNAENKWRIKAAAGLLVIRLCNNSQSFTTNLVLK